MSILSGAEFVISDELWCLRFVESWRRGLGVPNGFLGCFFSLGVGEVEKILERLQLDSKQDCVCVWIFFWGGGSLRGGKNMIDLLETNRCFYYPWPVNCIGSIIYSSPYLLQFHPWEILQIIWKYKCNKKHTYTLPKTNIAMENPPFWWYLQGNMGIFMGYVSFREGISIPTLV